MKLKFIKTVLGAEYIFYVTFSVNSIKCIVRQYCSEKELEAVISDDFKHIILYEPIKLMGYYNGITPQDHFKMVDKLTISKEQASNIKDYVL